MRDLIRFEVPYTSVIVVGVDPRGAHIYVVDDGNISCNDVIGLAAIGIGARHAESQFMLAKHAWNSALVDTALLAYIAKKRSEIAPGVGEATDMFTVGPGLGTLSPVPDDRMDEFERIYQGLRYREEQSWDEARKEANDFVTKAAQDAAERTQGQQESLVDREATPEGRPKTQTD